MTSLLDFAYERDEEDQDWLELTFTQRVIGFATTALLGVFSGFLSILAISLFRLRKFGILFSIFNVMIILSTGFLIGFKKQFKSLFEAKRYFATAGMFLGLSITMVFAFKWKRLVGVIFGFCVEFVSFAYYALSYLPWGPQVFQKCFQCCPCPKFLKN
jgi:hypothetical protein